MAHLVEGDWKEFAIKFVTPADHNLIFEFLRQNWYAEEIMAKYSGADEDFIQEIENFCKLCFAEDISFIAWHKETNEIAGLRLTFTSRKTDKRFELKSTGMKKLMTMVNKLDAEANLYERFEVDYLASFVVAATGRKFRGQGLVTEMYRRTIALLKSKGYPLCKSVFTSPYTRKAVTNLGFTEFARAYLKDIYDENGDMCFKGCAPEDLAVVLCLKL